MNTLEQSLVPYRNDRGNWYLRPTLPVLHPAGTRVAEATTALAFAGSIPVMTLPLYYMENFYNFDEELLSKLCIAGLIPHVGDPTDYLECYADLESAARAYVMWKRYLGFPEDEVASIIRRPETGGTKLRDTLCEFMRGECFGRAHQGNVCGEHVAPEGYEYAKSFPTYRALRHLEAYMRKPRG